jgi:hypothetical protein
MTNDDGHATYGLRPCASRTERLLRCRSNRRLHSSDIVRQVEYWSSQLKSLAHTFPQSNHNPLCPPSALGAPSFAESRL